MVVLGGWLDSMILKVISNLRFYESMKRDGGILLTLKFSFCRTFVVYDMMEHHFLGQYFLLM